MAKQISSFVKHLFQHDAQAIILTSGAPAVVRFATGDRSAAHPIDHARVQALVNECATPSAAADLRMNRPCSFTFDDDGKSIQVDVMPKPGAWRVTITRVGAAAPAPRAPAPIALEPDDDEPFQKGPAMGTAPAGIAAAPAPVAAPAPARASGGYGDVGTVSVERYLRLMSDKGGSDLHLSCGQPPMVRLHGSMEKLEPGPVLEPEVLKQAMYKVMAERNIEEFERRHDTDFAYEIPGMARFRGNAFMDRRGIGGVFRKIPFEILPPEKLGLPQKVLDLCYLTKGLVVVTGPTGSGKSTTLATLIDVINNTRDDHIITIEDPIEFVHENKKCLVNQREVKVHTDSFKDALRAALREDPDIILVGEMRDLETIAIAIETAETGHLVFGTLHTTTAAGTVDRIIDQFPADRQAQVRTMLSESLKGVIAQVLCKKIGGGRAAAYEILIGTPAIANLIREGKTFQIPSMMQTGRNIGMCTMNDSLMDHVKNGRVEPKEAYMKSVNKSEMANLLNQGGFKYQ